MSVIKQFVIQRYVHKSFGTRESYWSNFAWEGDVANEANERDLMDTFKKDQHNEDLAMKVLKVVSTVRKGEKFRIVERITTVEETPLMEMGPRKIFSLDDLRELAENPIAHDGVRDTNENVLAIQEAGLDPCRMGAYPTALVLFALDHIDNQPDEWFLVHNESYSPRRGYDDWNHTRTWWNLGQQSYITFESQGFDDKTGSFTRHSYGENVSKGYRTFNAAATQDKKNTCKKGRLKLENAQKTFPQVREL